jgi:hypothetical protein
MNRTAPRIAYFGCFLMGALALGCGGSSAKKMMYADASGFDTASSTAGAGGGNGGSGGAVVDAGTDADGGPVASAGSKLVLGGESIQLIGSGPDTCTNQVPATADRWCGFVKPASTLGNFELWVINISKVAANVTVKCDTTDQNCLRLSTGLYSDPTNGFRIHGFDGDTLDYSEVPTLSANAFIGKVSVWRPGWTGGRVLTSNTGVVCNGSAVSNAAICIENPVTDSAGNTTAELHAGTLDAQSGGTLPLIDSLFVFGAADAAGVQKWSASLTPDGASVAWSTRVLPTDTENLKIQKLVTGSSPVPVATDVSQWAVTSDSSAWLWLKGYNYDQSGAPSGTLQSATFPGGGGAKTLATGVGDFNQAGTKGVLYRTQVAANSGTLILQADRDSLAAGTMIDQGVFFVFEVTKDGKTMSYTKTVQSLDLGTTTVPIFDLYVAFGGAKSCALTTTPTAFLAPNFLSAGDIAAWGNLNKQTGEVAGEYTTISNCATRKFAADVFSWTPIADEGFVYLDTLSPDPSLNEATLRYGKVSGGLLPPTGTPIQTRAALNFATLLPSISAVVYTVATGTTGADGLYVNATLPFSTTAGTPTDGGTAEPDGPTDTTTGSDATGADVGATEGGPADAGSETGAADAAADADNG